jgi:hypothetical protein
MFNMYIVLDEFRVVPCEIRLENVCIKENVE